MRLKWKCNMTYEEKKRAVETALLLGFHSTAAEFPIVSEKEGTNVPESIEGLCDIFDMEGTKAPEGYVSSSRNAKPIPGLDFRKHTGLELLFTEGRFLKDENFDLLPDVLDVRFVLPENAEDSVWKAACDMAYRFGMETTAYEGNIIAEEGYQGNTVEFRTGDKCGIYVEATEGAAKVTVEGSGEELEAFVSLLCQEFPMLPEKRTWQSILMDMADSFAMRNLDGEITAAEVHKGEGRMDAYVSPEFEERREKCEARYPEVTFHNYKSGNTIYQKEYEFPWEKEVFEQLLEEKVYPVLKSGDSVSVYGALSEEKKGRAQIAAAVERAVQSRQATVEANEIVCAYKQGFSWIDEIVLPELTKKKAKKVIVFFKPFLPEGETQWLDENGATPSYNNLKADDPDHWYDLPIRYLQELYPIADVIMERLGIEQGQIEFQVYEGAEDITYLCVAEDETGEKVYENTYKAACAERPYLDEYPQMGKVHPSTGYIKVCINGETVLEENIKTDLEYIWDKYQSEVLPDCKKYVEEKFGDNICAEMQPLFNELRLEVTASEPDYRLNSREDLISSLDALHEDMYFVGADYFKNYGVHKADVMLDAPGLILPIIHQGEGRPRLKVTLSEQLRQSACLEKDGKVLASVAERESVDVSIAAISKTESGMEVTLKTRAPEKTVEAYARLLEEGILEMSGCFANTSKLIFETSGQTFAAQIKEAALPEKSLRIQDIDLHENQLIGYDECMEILEQLKQVPGIEVFPTARSYMGRRLYAIELLPKEKGYVSYSKRLTRLPSEFINTRHHANEVSGTNAMFLLLKKLLTDDAYKDLPDKLNLVMVPMENVDGTAIHYELQKEHPYWKFHVARFNAIGKEFYREHFVQDTIHREAMGLTRLYRRYIPDILVDNHGVPSHEWEQQFSGYTSPSYKGFWLPRSLLYGYFWYVTDEEYKSNYPVNKEMEDVIADEMARDAEMTKWNREWAAQFEAYAHGWMPKLFPADYYKDMINYWIPFPYDAEHRYPSIRFPWITTVAYTSEVADETAQGEYLNLCARAHVAHDEATLQMLMKAEHVFDYSVTCRDNKIFSRYMRQRPMIVSGLEKNK